MEIRKRENLRKKERKRHSVIIYLYIHPETGRQFEFWDPARTLDGTHEDRSRADGSASKQASKQGKERQGKERKANARSKEAKAGCTFRPAERAPQTGLEKVLRDRNHRLLRENLLLRANLL